MLVTIKLTNGDSITVENIQEILEVSVSTKETSAFSSESDFKKLIPYSDCSYSFIGQSAIFTVMGSKIEYAHFLNN